VRPHDALPVAVGDEVEARAEHVLAPAAKLLDRRDGAPDRLPGLTLGIAGMEGGAVGAERRRAADGDVLPRPGGPGVGGGALEAAAFPVARQPLNVIVLCVEIAPPL
jgi:hypothetical protein